MGETCKRCGHDSFLTVDDLIDVRAKVNKNIDVIINLNQLVHTIKSECTEFEKKWDNAWNSNKDAEYDVPCELEINDYSYLVNED